MVSRAHVPGRRESSVCQHLEKFPSMSATTKVNQEQENVFDIPDIADDQLLGESFFHV